MKKKLNLQKDKTIGEVLVENVYDNYDILIIGKDITINKYILNRLIDYEIEYVFVYEEPKKELKKNSNEILKFKNSYYEQVNATREIYKSLSEGEGLDLNIIIEQRDALYPKDLIYNYDLISCIKVLKNIDEYTYTHGINVGLYSVLIGRWLELNEEQTKDLLLSGILHDIGKSKIPLSILNKPSRLLPSEFKIMKKHPMEGFNLIKDIPDLKKTIKRAVLMHHEREDGKGYPFGIKGNKMDLFTKIVTVADVYDALTSKRVYKSKLTPFDTFNELLKNGYGHFDTNIMLTFLKNISERYIGYQVKLNNGETGEIVFIPPNDIVNPIIRTDNKLIDLKTSKNYKIIEMI